jgi:hypothetical protein|tara:strand:+ start:436 stop:624 length:189 start_codon:yes stop_codon:yes gene_type:complete
MDKPDEYTTYWYESQDGEVEPIEVRASDDPPAQIIMPTDTGIIESFFLVDDNFDDSDLILDD